VQHECIPQSTLGTDVLCQAKSGMGKTAVFVLTTLQLLDDDSADKKHVSVVVLCHARELAYQICGEYERFSKYMGTTLNGEVKEPAKDNENDHENNSNSNNANGANNANGNANGEKSDANKKTFVRLGVFFGGVPMKSNEDVLKNSSPNVVIGTPGRMVALVRTGALDLSKVKSFVIDECDRVLDQVDMRADVQEIFRATPRNKQVMMFSATLSPEVRPICKRFMQAPIEIYVDNEAKLTLHGLAQFFVKVEEKSKNKQLIELLDSLEFNQVVVFVSKVGRARALAHILNKLNFPAIDIHSDLSQDERIKRYKQFKDFKARVLVATDLFGRGMDIERVNIVINYDMASDADPFLHRVGRAGRFGTKGLAVSFITTDKDQLVLDDVHKRFAVQIPALPDKIDSSTYMGA